MVAGAQVSGRLAGRVRPALLIAAGLGSMRVGGVIVPTVIGTNAAGLAGVLPRHRRDDGVGTCWTECAALAMHSHPHAVGFAAAVVAASSSAWPRSPRHCPASADSADPLRMAILVLAFPVVAIATLIRQL
jgi:hypothetical protein